MKKYILPIVAVIAALLFSCTKNDAAKHYGGTARIDLPKGQRLIVATWKESNLWYLTEAMPEGYAPQDKTFKESSKSAGLEGTVIFHESK